MFDVGNELRSRKGTSKSETNFEVGRGRNIYLYVCRLANIAASMGQDADVSSYSWIPLSRTLDKPDFR